MRVCTAFAECHSPGDAAKAIHKRARRRGVKDNPVAAVERQRQTPSGDVDILASDEAILLLLHAG